MNLALFRFAADENLHGEIYNRLRTELPDLDILRVQDTGITGRDDETMLAWVASEQRILLTHDKRTIVPIYSDRLVQGQPVPAVFMISNKARIDLIVSDLLMIIGCSAANEWVEKLHTYPCKAVSKANLLVFTDY